MPSDDRSARSIDYEQVLGELKLVLNFVDVSEVPYT